VIRVLDARFVTTAVAPDSYPPEGPPEVAFVGRSNVGKSSMINALAGRRKLVRVSNTPGRTRTLNFFDVDLEEEKRRVTVRLADLPGYGFAKASKAEKKTWQSMISTYLGRRKTLRAAVALVDGEVGASPEDSQTVSYLVETVNKILVVATKMDRVPKAKRRPQCDRLAEQLDVPRHVIVPFSATEKWGVDEVWESLLGQLDVSGFDDESQLGQNP